MIFIAPRSITNPNINLSIPILNGLLIGFILPFLGTALGASCVLFMKNAIKGILQNLLIGFAAGVMVAASVWSLLIPSIHITGKEGFMSVLPAVIGFLFGIFFLLSLDVLIPHQHIDEEHSEGPKSKLSKTSKLVLAITLHNIPEGMAVGVAFAAAMGNSADLPVAGAIALAVGMAIQNFPEGAIVSMPLRTAGNSRTKSFLLGVASGVVEPIAMGLTLLITDLIYPLLPYVLAFSAGAMMYVVVEELIPETQADEHSNLGTIGFALGFVLMMILDVVLG